MQLKEKLNPKNDIESRDEFLRRFDWTDTMLTETEKQAVEDILVEYHDIFARHRMDIGMNTEFKMRLTPKDDKAVYSQNLPMPIHLKEDLIVELALMHKYGIITVLHVDYWKLHTKDACVDWKNYSIMTDHVNTNTFQG